MHYENSDLNHSFFLSASLSMQDVKVNLKIMPGIILSTIFSTYSHSFSPHTIQIVILPSLQ